MKKHRLHPDVTPDNVTPKDVTPLSRIKFIQSKLTPHLIKTIEEAAKIFNDQEIRYERAYHYKHRKEDRTPIVTSIVEQRPRLQKICDSLGKRNLQEKVYYGCGTYALSMDVVNDLLDTTN